MRIEKKGSVNAAINVLGDKSITHRAIMLNSIAKGNATIKGALLGEDCLATIDCMRKLGANIEVDGDIVKVEGVTKYVDGAELYVGNSGTTLRLLTGLIASLGVNASITGDASILKRPIQRVVNPLESMGADISTNKGFCPVSIRPAALKGITYTMPVASAQVKSAVILAGLNAEGETIVIENTPSRNHTELMLGAMGADIRVDGNRVFVKPSVPQATDIEVPADISSAAYFLVLGSVLPNSSITVKNVGVNPSRTGIIEVINQAGGNVTLSNERVVCGERVADITAKSAKLKAFKVGGELIPRLIDEIPILAVLACFAEGKSMIVDACELRVKESDRIATTADMIKRLGGIVTPKPDGLVIEGTGRLEGGLVETYGDHRIAMSAGIALSLSDNGGEITGGECVDVSFPKFFRCLAEV